MQTENGKDSKVVSLLDRNNQGSKSADSNEKKTEADFSWEEVMKRNAENANRMKSERQKANKGVIRSYRLKH